MTMKRFFGMMTALVMTALTFTSCRDEDVDTSMVLSGDWYGDFGMYYEYQYRNGDIEIFDSYDTDISFYPDYDYATHGYGYQVDYYKYGPYRKIYHSFEWRVSNNNIYITYPKDHFYDATIYEYRMTHNYFTGYFDTGSSPFKLEKYNDYYDWNPYWNDYGRDGYGYYWYDGWYAPTRGNAEATDSLGTDEAAGTILRFGNRFGK